MSYHKMIARVVLGLAASAALVSGLLAVPASAVESHKPGNFRLCGAVQKTKNGPKAPCIQVKDNKARIGTKLPKQNTINWRPWLPKTGKVSGGATARDGFRGKYVGVRYGKPQRGFVRAVQFKKKGDDVVNRPGWIDRPGNRFVPVGRWHLGPIAACQGAGGVDPGAPAGYYEGMVDEVCRG